MNHMQNLERLLYWKTALLQARVIKLTTAKLPANGGSSPAVHD